MSVSRVHSWLLGFAVLGCASVLSAESADPALFSWGEKSYRASDFSDALQDAVYQVEAERFEKLTNLADSMLIELHLNAEAQKQGTTIDALAGKLFASAPPPDAEINRFYEENKVSIPQPFDQVKGQIAGYLQQKAMEEKRKALVAELKKKQQFKLAMTEPNAPVMTVKIDGYPFQGPENAPVTLVVFADYQCPHCKMETAELKKLMAKYAGKIRMVYRDFPINQSGISTKVAEGAECAFQQGKFWEYHDMAFELQSGLSKDSPNDIAEALELDDKKFKQCLNDPATAKRVVASKAEAVSLHVTGTPTIFINGRKQVNSHGGSGLDEAIQAALAQ